MKKTLSQKREGDPKNRTALKNSLLNSKNKDTNNTDLIIENFLAWYVDAIKRGKVCVKFGRAKREN